MVTTGLDSVSMSRVELSHGIMLVPVKRKQAGVEVRTIKRLTGEKGLNSPNEEDS